MTTKRSKTLVWLGLVGCICALAACGGAGGDDDDDNNGSGGTVGGGSGGTTSGAGKDGGGTGGNTMVGGTGGKGAVAGMGGAGSGGSSGSGGVSGGSGGDTGGGDGMMSECSMAGAAKEGSCKDKARGVYGIKTTFDAYWSDEQNPDAPIVDPGRGDIVIYLLAHIEDFCEDGSNGVGVIKACGSELPAFTSELSCDAYQLQFDNALWDQPMMPTFKMKGSATGFAPGDTLSIAQTIGLVGVELNADDQTWPTAAETGTVPCKDGKTGAACFPDQDGDGEPGITVTLKTGGTYMPPGCGTGADQPPCKCGVLETDFTYRGSPTVLDITAGGGLGGGIRAARVHIGLRTTFGGGGKIADDCNSGNGDGVAPENALESRAVSCHVDPASLPEGDTAHPDNACSGDEATFVDENVPNYHILQKDAKPPAQIKNQAVSKGPQSEMVRIGELNGTFDCAAARAAFQ